MATRYPSLTPHQRDAMAARQWQHLYELVQERERPCQRGHRDSWTDGGPCIWELHANLTDGARAILGE